MTHSQRRWCITYHHCYSMTGSNDSYRHRPLCLRSLAAFGLALSTETLAMHIPVDYISSGLSFLPFTPCHPRRSHFSCSPLWKIRFWRSEVSICFSILTSPGRCAEATGRGGERPWLLCRETMAWKAEWLWRADRDSRDKDSALSITPWLWGREGVAGFLPCIFSRFTPGQSCRILNIVIC